MSYNQDNDDYITLLSADRKGIDFVEIADIAYNGHFYEILQPVELHEGMDDDETLVFEVSRGRNGEDHFEIVLSDYIIEKVFDEYNRLLDEQQR